ncbi:ABC transporter substrate-binding protein [Clostridium frigoris]|uniref:ABC transporter substrate-binding protein n=1 Tax=Clostridium frigoris TaxID=205327 RepID=A0ABS6BWA3_9CLOT|nr:ABC transporter substrate-binding protein [Clostridium frigoris]MBU3160690.1 ABC transporter substrate-binding protein [Clostridium frigoris]
MKTKKLIAIALTAIMTLSMAGCGTASKKSATTTSTNKKIVIWAWDGTFNVVAAKEAKAIYLKDHKGVDVQIVEMAQADIVQKLNTNLSSNTTAGLPNIVLIEDYRSQNFLTSYPDAFKDMSSKVKTTNFMDYKLKSDSLNGKLYGIPFDSGVTALFYRTDLIEKAGYKKSDMENMTWDKFIEIGKAVKVKTGKAMLTLDPNDLALLRAMIQSCGQWYVKDDGKTINLENNVALKEAIKTYKKIMDAGIAKQVSDWDQFVSAFQKGDVASVPSGCWVSSSITKATDQNGKWAVASIPRLEAVKTSVNASNIGGSSWYVLDKVGDSELASDFLAKTFGSNKELMNTLAQKINLISTLKSSSTTANYQKPVEFYGGQKTALDLSKWSTQIPTVNFGLYTYSIEDILTGTVQSIVKSGANIDTALKDAQKQAESAVVK